MTLERLQYRILDGRIGTTWPLPTLATAGSAGFDLRAAIDAPLTLEPGQAQRVPSGVAIFIDHPGYCALVLPRSGMGVRHGIVLANLVGLIDSDYQGPLEIALWNRSDEAFVVEPGERVAQLVVMPVAQPMWEAVEAFVPTERGSSGFGSTGRG